VTGLALNADDRALLSAGEDGAVLLWDLTRDQQLGQPLGPAQGRVWTLDLSPDGRLLAYARCDDLVNLEDDGCIRGRVGVVDLSEPDGGVAGEARAGPEIEAGVGGRTALRWSPDGGTLAVGGCARYDLGARRCAEGEVRLYAAGPGGRLSLSQALDGYADWVTSVDFSPDGRTLAAGSRLGAIDFRDPASGAMVGSPIAAHDGAVWQVAYDRQGARVASAGGDGRVGVWDARTGQAAVPALEGHAGAVWSVAFSPDGALLASGGADNAVRLWEAKTGQPAGRPLTGHARAINGLAFSPDGAALVSASGDATLMWWDVAARDRLGQAFRGPGNGVTQVEFTPDGLQFVSSSLDGRLVAWDASLASWLARACRVAHRGLTPAESAQYLGGAGEGGACGGIGD
jgi:WD40 repeat protein